MHATPERSVGQMALVDHLGAKSEDAVRIFQAVRAALDACGDHRIHAQKTRIAFIDRMTFAGARLNRRWVDLTFITPTPVDDVRIRRIEVYGPTSFNHFVRLRHTDDVDVDVRRWLGEALRRGRRETLDPSADVEPLVGRPLEIVLVPLRVRVVQRGGRLSLRLPRFAWQVFGAHPEVNAKLGRTSHPGRIERGVLVLDGEALAELGLGEGDRTDVFLTADV